MGRSWDLKLGGKPLYLFPTADGGGDVSFATDESEPAQIGQVGTLVIPSLHHGIGPVIARDAMSVSSFGTIDISVPGSVLRAGGLTTVLANIADENWYDNQGGGLAVYPHLNVASDQRLMAITARRIYQINPSGPTATEVYVLDNTKYAFTGSWAIFRGSIYFGVESNTDQTARGYYGAPMVRYNISTNAFSTVAFKGSIVQAARGGIWWVENRGLADTPQVYWSDDTIFPSDPISSQATFAISAGANDGIIYKYKTTYPPNGTAVVNTNLLRVGQEPPTPTYYYKHRGYLKWAIAGLPSNAVISAAKIRLYATNRQVGTAFNIKVRRFDWGTLGAEDWRLTPTNDPLLATVAAGTLVDGWNEITLDANQIPISGSFEIYLISDKDENNLSPTTNEYVVFEHYEDAGTNHAELVIDYTYTPTLAVAGPFPIEPGGYCTAGGGVLGPWVVWFKHDGQIYGLDKEGMLAPVVPQGMTKADLRFGRGNCVYNQLLVVPHAHGCLTLNMSDLSVADIHPAKTVGGTTSAIPLPVGASLWFGPRLFMVLNGTYPYIFALDRYPDGDYYSPVQVISTGGLVNKGLAIAAILTSTGAAQLFVLSSGDSTTTRIDRVSLPGMNWSAIPGTLVGGSIITPFHSGDGALSLITKRFFRIRSWAAEVSGTDYYSLGFAMDGSGSYTSLGTITSPGPFSLPFPSSSASLGRAMSLQIGAIGSSLTRARLECPILADFEYVPATHDRWKLGILASPQSVTNRGDATIRDSAQDIEDFLRGLEGTVTTLVWPNQNTWTVLVEKVTGELAELTTALTGKTEKFSVWVRRL